MNSKNNGNAKEQYKHVHVVNEPFSTNLKKDTTKLFQSTKDVGKASLKAAKAANNTFWEDLKSTKEHESEKKREKAHDVKKLRKTKRLAPSNVQIEREIPVREKKLEVVDQASKKTS